MQNTLPEGDASTNKYINYHMLQNVIYSGNNEIAPACC